MRVFPILLVLFAMTSLFMACSGGDNDVRDAATEAVTPATPTPDAAATTPATPPTAEPAQNAEGVWHYTCPNGCEGGAGAAGPCPKCGAQLVHNAAYHASANQQQPVQLESTTPPTTTPEPAQNAKGVWHYTCPNGCEGGAGAAGPCPKCGAQLVHNSAYHQ